MAWVSPYVCARRGPYISPEDARWAKECVIFIDDEWDVVRKDELSGFDGNVEWAMKHSWRFWDIWRPVAYVR